MIAPFYSQLRARSLALSSLTKNLSISFSLAVLILYSNCASAKEKSYWLEQGGDIIRRCDGNSNGEMLKAANKDGGWLLITAVVVCIDKGTVFQYTIKFARVSINPRARDRIPRQTLKFDWLGFAVFKPIDEHAEFIRWMYDEAFPIDGELNKDSTTPIFFGNVTFEVPKSDVLEATKMLFYFTSQGPIYVFEVL